MTSRAKKILLLILSIIAISIWIRNLNLFESGSGYYQVALSDKTKAESTQSKLGAIEYKKPRLNPFLPAEKPQKKNNSKSKTKQPDKKEPERISARFRIDGIVVEADNPQAILSQPGKENLMVSLSDTLNGWVVKAINDERIIFSNGKYKDTLCLLINQD